MPARIPGWRGCLLHLHPDTRLGAEFPLRPQVFDIFWAQDYVIAQLELLAVLQGIITFADQLRNTSRVWFIDNIAALMSLVRGRSDNGDLDNMASMVHFLFFAINCQCYFDWVESKANWVVLVATVGVTLFGRSMASASTSPR